MKQLKPKTIPAFFILLTLIFSCVQKPNQNNGDANLRLITYNVWYGFTQVPERKPLWLNWMKAQKPDIVCLQELNEYTPEMLKKDAAFYGHLHAVLLKEDGFPTGITSKHPIEDIQKRIDGFHHGLIRVKIKNTYVYTVHLHPSNFEFRKKEIALILSDIETLPPNVPIIIAGDFNTVSPCDQPWYAHKLLEPFFAKRDAAYHEHNLNNNKLDYSVIQTLLNHEFTDIENMMRGEKYAFTGTFPTKIAKEGDHGQPRRLDYIFSNAPLLNQVKRAFIAANDTTWILSDHLPVIVDFKRNEIRNAEHES